ncbi:hypothetical protein ACXZ1K_07795 [Pedobacter sp. PWIIR3]
MDYLLAKVKRKSNLFKILTDQNIFEIPITLEDSIVYDPATLIEEEEWYKIDNFSQSPFALDFLKNAFISANHDQIARDHYVKIQYLCSVQTQYYCFQVINSHSLLKRSWVSISDNPEIIKDKPVVMINKVPDSIYNKNTDILHFKKISVAKMIFNGLDTLYREATDVETQNFLANDFISLQNGFDLNSVKIPNRKRIALVMDTLNNFTQVDKDYIYQYIQTYCQVPFNNNSFEISTEDDLKNILFGIEQRFYTTQLGNERRIANSIISL